jgi:hypothetical protein
MSGRRNSFKHLLLTSAPAILFGFGPRLDIIKCHHSSKPDALYKQLEFNVVTTVPEQGDIVWAMMDLRNRGYFEI